LDKKYASFESAAIEEGVGRANDEQEPGARGERIVRGGRKESFDMKGKKRKPTKSA